VVRVSRARVQTQGALVLVIHLEVERTHAERGARGLDGGQQVRAVAVIAIGGVDVQLVDERVAAEELEAVAEAEREIADRAARILGLEKGPQFSEKVIYVYRKQLEEANLIVVNKTDAIPAARIVRDADAGLVFRAQDAGDLAAQLELVEINLPNLK